MKRQDLVISVRLAIILSMLLPVAASAQPVRSAWIMNPTAGQSSEGLARSLPDVHFVEIADDFVVVRSAGISVHNLAPFQSPPTPVERLRRFAFRIPAEPRPAAEVPASVRPDILGVFLNGQPIYNYFDVASYQGQNIWRYDLIARNDDGKFTAGGAPREQLEHKLQLGILQGMVAGSGGHSPILGYAFDGSPVYGPWSFANVDGSGGVRRLSSSYQMRSVELRTEWPDGRVLTPGQSGPAVDPANPLGSFVEDYDFVAGSGDLDRFNGRLAVTPEYPDGVYAYFLSTDEQGRLAFPYLIGGRYHGQISPHELDLAVLDHEVDVPDPDVSLFDLTQADQAAFIRFQAGPENITAGQPALLSFQLLDTTGEPIRSLEHVHERPIHLLVVSEDLSRFDHIHPELRSGDRYVVRHTFPVAGRYRLYADYTPPGGRQRVESFQIRVDGDSETVEPLLETDVLSQTVGPIHVELESGAPLTTARDIELVFRVRDAATGKRIPDLTPFLGAWGHFVLIQEGHRRFIHAHPIEAGQTGLGGAISHSHIHGAGSQALGPPPSNIRVLTNFEHPGLYKLWAQFGIGGDVVTVPFVLRVGESAAPAPDTIPIPEGAAVIHITSNGFEPTFLAIDSGSPATLAFVRTSEPNCGSSVVFPALRITAEVPLGGVAMIELPASQVGQLTFACGMGMYRGAIVIQESTAAR